MDRNYRRRTSVGLLYLSLDYDTADDRVEAAVILDGPVGLACHQLRCNLIAANRDNRDGVFCRAAGTSATVCVLTGAGAAASRAPHLRQKLAVSLLARPHAGQANIRDANPPSDPDYRPEILPAGR